VADRAEESFRRHRAQLLRFVRRRVPDDDEAEDVVAAVFADAIRGLGRFQPGATPELAWLYTVARRRLADRARALARRRASLEALERDRLELVGEREYGTQVAVALRAALARLPEPQRQVVVLKLLRGLPFADIATRLGTTEAACKMRFARGLEAVRDELAGEGLGP
jgi:RNA polymerase sigma factor (sigma-70 family)